MTPDQMLANWILSSLPPNTTTHLKLQKLAFYCVGAALAYGCEAGLGGTISFEAWEHGPVSRVLWNTYRDHGAQAIPSPAAPVGYGEPVRTVLQDVLEVYGVMTAWQLRQQSHLEKPWMDTPSGSRIGEDAIRTHFRGKFFGNVRLPEMLAQQWSFSIDGMPVLGFPSLHDLARSLRSASGGT